MVVFTEEKEAAIVTEQSFSWKKNCLEVQHGWLKSTGMITNARIKVAHIDTVVYVSNPKKPAIPPLLRIIGKGTVLCEMDIAPDYMEDVQDWLMDVIDRHS